MNAADKKAAKTLNIPSEKAISLDNLRQFHRKEALRTHPDCNKNVSSEEFIAVQNSYERLLKSFEKHKEIIEFDDSEYELELGYQHPDAA